jgi:ADP-ribose pyrophosphatase
MSDDEGYRTISSRIAYQGEIIAVAEEELLLPDGRVVGREMVIHPGAVGIVAITSEGCVVLVEQYRNPIKRTLLEIPAGKLSGGEDPLQCAQRELAEETGYTGRTWTRLGSYYTTPGFTDERFHMFLALDLEAGVAAPEGHEEELMHIHEPPFDEAVADALACRLEDGKTLAGLLLAEPHVRRLRAAGPEAEEAQR